MLCCFSRAPRRSHVEDIGSAPLFLGVVGDETDACERKEIDWGWGYNEAGKCKQARQKKGQADTRVTCLR